MSYTSFILRSVPVGGIIPSSFDFGQYDDNFMDCSGYELIKTGYKHLFNVIGTQFGETDGSGGIGTTHFRVPDCRGLFLCHTSNTISFPMGSYSSDILGYHYHDIYDDANDVTQFNQNNNIAQGDHDPSSIWAYNSNYVGGNETRPKNIYVKYYIRYI